MPTYDVTLNTQYGYKKNYDALSGTSMAAPVVAGLAGLLMSWKPSLTAMQVKGIIESTAGNGASFDLTSGFGAVHASDAIVSAGQPDFSAPVLNSLLPAFGTTLVRDVGFSTTATDNGGVHHVDFVSGGARSLLPATAVGYQGGGKGKNATGGIAPWSSVFSSTTKWNGAFDLTALAIDRYGNTSVPSAGSYEIKNAYATRVFTTHACDPSRADCPKDIWDGAFSLDFPAIVKMRVEWLNSSFSANYAGDVAGLLSDGHVLRSVGAFPRYWTGTSFEYDFGRAVFCGGCNTNRIGGGLGHLYLCINKDCPITPGMAETDISTTFTYPQ